MQNDCWMQAAFGWFSQTLLDSVTQADQVCGKAHNVSIVGPLLYGSPVIPVFWHYCWQMNTVKDATDFWKSGPALQMSDKIHEPSDWMLWTVLTNRILLGWKVATAGLLGPGNVHCRGGTQDGAQRWACPGPQACGPEEQHRGSLPFWMAPESPVWWTAWGFAHWLFVSGLSWTLSRLFFTPLFSHTMFYMQTQTLPHTSVSFFPLLSLSVLVIVMWRHWPRLCEALTLLLQAVSNMSVSLASSCSCTVVVSGRLLKCLEVWPGVLGRDLGACESHPKEQRDSHLWLSPQYKSAGAICCFIRWPAPAVILCWRRRTWAKVCSAVVCSPILAVCCTYAS